MAIACPVDLNTAALRSEISSIYGRVASEPDGEFHFHRGPAYAAGFLGYGAAELAALPSDCTASFAGVGNPLAIGQIHAGETVLDIGCGAGMDLLLAAGRTGPAGTPSALTWPTPWSSGRGNRPPKSACLRSKSEKAMPHLCRLELPEDARRNIDLWTGWIAGALPEAEPVAYLSQTGLEEVQISARFDCFRTTSKEKTARKYGVHGVNVFARKSLSAVWRCPIEPEISADTGGTEASLTGPTLLFSQTNPNSRVTLVLYRCDLKVAEMIVCRKDEFIRRAVPSALPYEAWREGNDSSWNPPTTYPAIERSASEPRGDGAAASIKVARGQGW